MDIRNNYGAFANRRRHTFHGLGWNVPDGKDSGHAGGVRSVLKPMSTTGQDEAFLIKLHSAEKPPGVRLCADHHEYAPDRLYRPLAGHVICPGDGLQGRFTFELLDLGIGVKGD